MTKFLNVLLAILSAGLIIQYLFGLKACILYSGGACLCLISCFYLFLKKPTTTPATTTTKNRTAKDTNKTTTQPPSPSSLQEEGLWYSTVVNFCQNFGENLANNCSKLVKSGDIVRHPRDNLYLNLNKDNKKTKKKTVEGGGGNLEDKLSEKTSSSSSCPNIVSSLLAAMFGFGEEARATHTNFSLFSLLRRKKKNTNKKDNNGHDHSDAEDDDAGVWAASSSSDGIGRINIKKRRETDVRRGGTEVDVSKSRRGIVRSGSPPMAGCTAYTYSPSSPSTSPARHHHHHNRITGIINRSCTPTINERSTSNRSPLATRVSAGNRSYHIGSSSPLPRFHRTASETQQRPAISPVGFTPHALQRQEVCYPTRNVLGNLPNVHLEKKIKIPLLETNVNKLRSPVTVRIAPPETGAIHSPKFTSLKHDTPTTPGTGDVLAALREGSRKRANNEEDSVIMINNVNAKRRRQESNHSTASSSSSIPSLSDFLPDLALCNFSPTYMSPDPSRYMSSPAVSAAMSIDDVGGSGSGVGVGSSIGGVSTKRPATHCAHSPHSEGSPNLKRSRYRCKNNPILSSLSSSHRYMKRQTAIGKRKLSDLASGGSFQHSRQSKENYENISSDLETEKSLGKVMKPSLDVSVNEDSYSGMTSEKQPEHTPQSVNSSSSVEIKKNAAELPRRKLLSFTTPGVNMEKLSYANVYATKQDYENDRKSEQERVEKMLDSIANDKTSAADKDITAKTGIEISKNLISTTKSLETSVSKSSTVVSHTTVASSVPLTSSLLSSPSSATTTTAAWSVTPSSLSSTTTTLSPSSTSSTEQPARLTSNTTSVNSMITPLPSLSTSAYPKSSEATAVSPPPSSISTSATSQIQGKNNLTFDSKVTSPSTTPAQANVPSGVSVMSPQQSSTSSSSGLQFTIVASPPSVTAATTGPFNFGSPFGTAGATVSPVQTTVVAPLPAAPADAVKAPSVSSSTPSSAGFSLAPKTDFAFPTSSSVAPTFGAGNNPATASAAPMSPASVATSPASFPSFKAGVGSNPVSGATPGVAATSGMFAFVNAPSTGLSQPTSSTAATLAPVTFGALNGAPGKFSFSATPNAATATTTATTTAAFGSSAFVFGAPTSTRAPVFGTSTSTASPVFGASTSTTTPAFGASTTPVFGAPTSSTTAAPVFGASTATPVFGTSPAKTSLVFGSPSSSAPAPIFGSPSSTATSSGFRTSTSSIFGAPTTSMPVPAFGVPASTVSSIFGSSNTSNTAAPTTATAGITTTATAAPSNSIFNISQTAAAASPIFGGTNVISTAPSGVFAAPATALNIFSSPTTTSGAGTAFGTTTKPAAATPAANMFSNPSSTFGAFKDTSSQPGQVSAASSTGAKAVFGSPTPNPSSGGFNFTLSNPTSKPASSIFDPANSQSQAVIFGNTGQQQQQTNQQQQKPDQKFNFTLNSNSGNPAPFGSQPTPFRSFESKPSIFGGQSSTAEPSAIKPATIFGQVPAATTAVATTGSAASVSKPLFGQLGASGFATAGSQPTANPTIFGAAPAATVPTPATKPADNANNQNANIFTFGKAPSPQPATNQGYDFSASMAGTSQFNFGQGVAMFNVGSGSTAPKMRSNNKARRRGGKK